MFAQARQEAHQRAGLEHAGAQAVGQEHAAAADAVGQAGHAEGRVGAQFQRIAKGIVLAAHDGMDPAQAGEGLQPDLAFAHGQIAAFDQGKAQIAGKQGVLEIGFVIRPRGQQYSQRMAVAARGEMEQGIAEGGKKARQMLDPQIAKGFGKCARDDQAIF